MKALSIVALVFSGLSIFIPIGGVFIAMLCSVMAMIAFRAQPTLAGIAFGVNIINTAFLSPSIMLTDAVSSVGAQLSPQTVEDESVYWFYVSFHLVFLVTAITWWLLANKQIASSALSALKNADTVPSVNGESCLTNGQTFVPAHVDIGVVIQDACRASRSLFMGAECCAAGLRSDRVGLGYSESHYQFFNFFVPNIAFAVLDERELKRTGRNAPAHWFVFLVPVYIWQRLRLNAQDKKVFYVWLVAFFASIMISNHADNQALAKQSCDLVTQIIRQQLGFSSQCISVSIGKEVKDGFYKATASLDNGNDLRITIDTTKSGQIYVQVLK